VILDGSKTQSFSSEQKKALLAWVAGGGTVILTHRAFSLGPDRGTWHLYDDAEVNTRTRSVDTEAVRALTGKFSGHIDRLNAITLRVPDRQRILWAGGRTLVAARDVGRGRVIGLGFDWKELDIDDHVIYESVREVMWRNLMALRRPRQVPDVGDDLVVPREARARFLVWYIVVFVGVYVLALALVNWLVLRGSKHMEYSVLTLPVGALVFACLSFAIGLSLRGDETLIHEAETLIGHHSREALVHGVTGILSPTTEPYRLTGSRPNVVVHEQEEQRSYWGGFRRPQIKGDKAYFFGDRISLGGLKIGMWTMGFFPTLDTEDLGRGLAVHGEFTAKGLTGRIASSLPFPLRDAYVIYRWNRTAVGDIQPGQTVDFALPVVSQDKLDLPRCPHCGGYHGRGWYSKGFCRRYPLSEEIRVFLSKSSHLLPDNRPCLVGWQDKEGYAVTVNHEVGARRKQRLCVFPVDETVNGPDVVFTEGTLPSTTRWRSLDLEPNPFVEAIHLNALAAVEKILEKEMGDKPVRRRRGSEDPFEIQIDGFMREAGSRHVYLTGFFFPHALDAVETTGLTVHWKLGRRRYDSEKPPFRFGLSIYDWTVDGWVDLQAAAEGEYRVETERPAHFVRLPAGLILLRVKAEEPDQKGIYNTTQLLDIVYKGQLNRD
jgi:hypothetical protein